MKLGVSAFAWTAAFGTGHLPLIGKVKEYGFAGFEIPMFVPSALPASELRQEFEANDLECTVCAILPAGINPISPNASVRKKSLAHLVDCVETAAEMGAHLFGGPILAPIGYLPGHRPTEDEWKWAVETIQSLGDLIEKNAMDLSIEPVNRSETFFLRTAAEAKEFCEDVGHPCMGVTVDTFHANIEEKDVPAAIDLLGFHLKHVHMSENDRGLLGTGHVDFAGCMKALNRIGYDGYLMIEGFGYSELEASAPGALWADVAVSPEDVAVMGIDYLRAFAGRLTLVSISVDRGSASVSDACMQIDRIRILGVATCREQRRVLCLAFGTAQLLGTTGCTLSLSPLAKHTATFSTATSSVVEGSKNAYLAANKLHIEEQTAAAIDSYGTPAWSPYTLLKPLLTPEQLAARTKVLDGLKAYASGLAGLTETRKRDKRLEDASVSAGANLASLSDSGAPRLETLFPGTTEASGVSTAIAGLSELLLNGREKRDLAKITTEMDPTIQALCRLIESDAKALQTEADRDYKGPIGNLDEFLQHHANADPVGRRTMVARMIALAQQQRLNDEMLMKLQTSVSALGEAHKALADAAAGKNPQTIKQKLQELISLGTELGAYYSSLQAAAATS